jgi:hypothetical protein
VEVADRDFMAVVPGVHRTHHAEVVHDPGSLREKFGNLDA